MKRLLTLLCVFAALSGVAQQKKKDPYIGMDVKAIKKQFGEPTSVSLEGLKGEVLIYKREHVSGTTPSVEGNTRGTTMISAQTYTFHINNQGKVRAWDFTPASQPDHTIIAN